MKLGAFWGSFLRVTVLMLALMAPAGLRAASDNSATQNEYCVATGSASQDLAAMLAGAEWRCEEPSHSLVPERTIMRFKLDPNVPTPRYLITRRNPLQTIHLTVEDADGNLRSESRTYEHVLPAMTGGFFKVPLPKVTPESRNVYVAIDMPTHVMTLQHAHLAVTDPGDSPAGRNLLLVLASLCGMLVMPLLFNASFYRILREPFVLWHGALAVSLMLTIIFNSGLSVFILNLSPDMISRWTTIVFGLSVASGGMFAHSFIEPDRLHPAIRKALPWAALWSLGVSCLHANFPFAGREWQTDAYYLSYLPVLGLYITLLVDALRRGSRAAKYQLIGWMPLMGVGVARIGSQLLPGIEPTDAMTLFYFGCVFEVMATALGVADRFMSLKDQRDRARTEAQVLEHISERDSLTGLNNRRVLEGRFDALRSEGFTTMAVLDLDHFKKINDTFGHAVGDEVLRAVAVALQPDRDTMVVRMGGEEFIILLRGRNAMDRAEHRRMAIVRHVAATTQVDRPVTASMGVVDAPLDAMPHAKFEAIYKRADQLLYEAKKAGRNRVMSERLQVFGAPDRRAKDDRHVA